MEAQKTWTVFFSKPISIKSEITQLYFITGKEEIFKVLDFKNDWRFCAVKNKRNEAVILGDVELSDLDFPINSPLILNNGLEILKENENLIIKKSK